MRYKTGNFVGRYWFSCFASILAAVLCCQNVLAESDNNLQPSRPNVLMIITDDQGWGDLSSTGNRNFETPNLDRLANEGARFENFYVCPVCSPTRCEVLTGRYHQSCGVRGVSQGEERFALNETTIADRFSSAGYRTALFGKWHSGTQHPYHPNDRGFAEFYGFTSGHWGNYFSPRLDHNGQLVTGDGYLSDDFTDHAIEFAKLKPQAVNQTDKPFFMMLCYNTPHSPMQVPDRWWDEYKSRKLNSLATDPSAEDPQFTRAALAMVANLDWNIGRLLDNLRQNNLLDNTIVMFLSDNGPNSFRYSEGLRGKKGSVDEGGVRSPLFIRYPAAVEAGIHVEQLAGAVDLMPTLAKLCDVDGSAKQDLPLDGFSLANYLNDSSRALQPRTLVSTWAGRYSLRDQKYRFNLNGELNDIEADRLQAENVATLQPIIADAMMVALKSLKQKFDASPSLGNRFPIGFTSNVPDQLPARDAKLSGDVHYSSRHPNCSFVTNWQSTKDRIVWPLDVLSDGNYSIEILYNCPKESLGSSLRLDCSEQQAGFGFQFEQAFESPMIGMRDDRVERDESYWKDFKTQRLQSLSLRKGHVDLTLRADTIKGGSAGEVGLLIITRID